MFLLYGFVDYSGIGTNSFGVLTGDQELDQRSVYGPENDHLQHRKLK